MKRYVSVLLAAGAILATVGTADAQTAGDWVLGNYKGSGYWFAGVIEKVQGDTITVRYDDNERETTNLSKVRPYDWMIGTKVECNFKGAGEWYKGTITSLAGEKVGIAYDDGDKETTKTGRCRTK
ncbi:ribosome maturation factor RimP [Aminobacter niigataensis]|uniref:Ribosome maturation factor RimP n=1 Tax=Aminobacter niigataensis TaxID=83265 RepID=A0ABR6L168_9HYPH|nr:tudor domain-containing protein [Aminobacter niigataensis]MBB4650502.1 ribosome maturation factor RimP [Aminobacter niigataensis]